MLPGGGRAINANMSTARDQTGQPAQAATAASASGGGGGGHGGHGGGEQGSDAEAAAANACSDEEYEPEWWLCVRPVSAAQRAQLKEEEANALAAADEKAKQDPAALETA